VTITAAPPVSNDALGYLDRAWLNQPWGAHVTDPEYHAWEAAYDRLASDAELGVPAAREALDVIDADVRAAIRRSHDLHRGTTGRGEDPRRLPVASMSAAGSGDGLEGST